MKFVTTALAALACAGTVSAFAPNAAFVPKTSSRLNTAMNANVLKLSDPMNEILDKTDVFIFDCDGVIWRVRLHYF